MRPTIYKSTPHWFTGVNPLWQRSPCLKDEQIRVLKQEMLGTQLCYFSPLSSNISVSARAKSRLSTGSFSSDLIPCSPKARTPTSSFSCLGKPLALCVRKEKGECEPLLALQPSYRLDGHLQRAKHGGTVETSRLGKWLQSNTNMM